jgi:hypothetical protein
MDIRVSESVDTREVKLGLNRVARDLLDIFAIIRRYPVIWSKKSNGFVT